MDWTKSDTIALAAPKCAQCRGLGLRWGRKGVNEPCNCVLRGIFRACYARFQSCATKEKYMSRTKLEIFPGKGGHQVWGRKDEEFVADFCLVSRRALDDEEYRLFKYHFLLGADWRLCCRKLKIDRGNFFHAVYRVEQKLGKVYRELEPYGLYPLDEYFFGTTRELAPQPVQKAKVVPIRPPMKPRVELPETKTA